MLWGSIMFDLTHNIRTFGAFEPRTRHWGWSRNGFSLLSPPSKTFKSRYEYIRLSSLQTPQQVHNGYSNQLLENPPIRIMALGLLRHTLSNPQCLLRLPKNCQVTCPSRAMNLLALLHSGTENKCLASLLEAFFGGCPTPAMKREMIFHVVISKPSMMFPKSWRKRESWKHLKTIQCPPFGDTRCSTIDTFILFN